MDRCSPSMDFVDKRGNGWGTAGVHFVKRLGSIRLRTQLNIDLNHIERIFQEK